MTASTGTIWTVILFLAAGTFLIRFSFLGIVGNRKLPEWLLRHLRYTPVAFLPAIAAPLVLWPAATDGVPDPARLAAAAVTIALGLWTRNVLLAVVAGLAVLFVGLALLPS